MRQSHMLGLLAIVAGAAIGVAWFALGGAEGGDALALEHASITAAPTTAAAPTRTPDRRSENPAGESRAVVADRRALRTEGPLAKLAADEVHWIEGTLLLPASAAWDETVAVLSVEAPDRERAARPLFQYIVSGGADEPVRDTAVLHRVPVASDGTFRIACAKGATWAYLDVDARFLYLSEPQAVRVEGEVTQVELAPLLGACIEGRWIAPADAEGLETSLAAGTVYLTVLSETQLPSVLSGALGDGPGVFHRNTTAVDGTFELRGVDPTPSWVLVSHPNYLASTTSTDLGLRPGEVAHVDVELVPGARLEGRVVERSGDGIPFATIEVAISDDEDEESTSKLLTRNAMSRGDGSFAVHGIAPGEVRLRAEKDGYRGSVRKRFDLAPGAVVTDIEVKLRRGEALRGRVTWADGQPAPGAVVQVGRDASGRSESVDNNWRTRGGEFACDAAGQFSIVGLKKRAQSVWAWSSRRVGERWIEGMAQLDGVEPSEDEEHALVLRELPLLTGVVRDVRGEPVTAFKLLVRPDEGRAGMMGMMMAGNTAIERDVASSDGTFRLERLGDGDFSVQVEAVGFATSVPVGFRLPALPGAAPIEITLTSFASVSGIVVDPSGAPVPGAEVSITRGELSAADMMLAEMRAPLKVGTNGRGEFAFTQVDPGEASIVAKSSDWVRSDAYALELRSGGVESALVIALRRGASLTGEVLDPDGHPMAQREIEVTLLEERREMFEGRVETSAETDANGWFELTGLVPGPARVALQPTQDEWGRLSDDGIDWWTLQQSMLRQEVVLVDGERIHVVLGGPAAASATQVEVSGRVTQRGAPVAGSVVFQREPLQAGGRPHKSELDERGAFALELPGAGDYRVTVRRDGAGVRTLYRHVTDADGQQLDLVLPACRIAGRVVGTDGEPANDVPMTLRRVGGASMDTQSIGGFFGGESTDEDGHYEFTDLEPGTYVVGAGSPMMSLFVGSAAGFGRTLSEPLTLAPDESRDRVDLRLQVPCELSGYVRDRSGDPLNGVSIFVYDASGVPVDSLSTTTTNASGRFTYAGLAEGAYSVLARNKDVVSELSVPIEVRPERPGEVELRADPGTRLSIRLVDDKGTPMRAAVSVVDERGHEVTGLHGFGAFFGNLRRGGGDPTTGEAGPVAPGRYRVTARAGDGRETSTEVVVRRGEAELEVRLELGSD
jgi:protocatechuate 3,4-dioxygenase beta subunit